MFTVMFHFVFSDNCDLNLRVRDNGLTAHPLTVEGFGFMWAGARAMFGVKSGKVAYEVKVSDHPFTLLLWS
jgi:heterogeneous nuclear ribonucleoprotein U-like protein 1